MDTTTMNDPKAMLYFALKYAKEGYSIFPLYWIKEDGGCSCPKGKACGKSSGKHPLTPNGFKDASSDPEQIRQWWTQNPYANIGFPTGVKNDLTILDVDGEEGVQALERFAAEGKVLPETRTVITGREQGKHLYFTYTPRFLKTVLRKPFL
jgi:hypothetical protein